MQTAIHRLITAGLHWKLPAENEFESRKRFDKGADSNSIFESKQRRTLFFYGTEKEHDRLGKEGEFDA